MVIVYDSLTVLRTVNHPCCQSRHKLEIGIPYHYFSLTLTRESTRNRPEGRYQTAKTYLGT